MIGRLLFVFILMLHGAVAAQLHLNEAQEYELGGYIDYYEDKEGFLSLEEVQKKPFARLDEAVPSFGFTSSAYWFKVAIVPSRSSLNKNWWLSIGYPLLDHIQFFSADDKGGWRSSQSSGELEAFGYRELPDRYFHFRVELSDRPVTLYVRVTTDGSM